MRLRVGSPGRFARARAQVAARPPVRGWFRSCRLADGTTYLRWTGLFEFLISPDGYRILYRRLDRATRESFSVYLLGHVLSFSLVARGIEPLHGTVVTIDGEAVAFLGDCGYGKSTLAAALLARGFQILTDDLVAVDERDGAWVVHPGVPRLKLFPAIARQVLGSSRHGTPMNTGTTKLVLPLGIEQATRQPAPLKRLYVLSTPGKGRSRQGPQVQIEHLSGKAAFLEVLRAAFNPVIVEKARLAHQFAFTSRLVASVPVRELRYPRSLSALPAVGDAVLADLAA